MLIKSSEYMLFVLYLILLIGVSLPFGSFDGFYWTSFGFAASVLLILAVVLKLVQKKVVTRPLLLALPFIALMVLHALYMLFQAYFNLSEPLLTLSYPEVKPDWFIQTSKLNVVPSNMVAWLGKLTLSLCFMLLALIFLTNRHRIKVTTYSIVLCSLIHAGIGLVSSYYKIHLVPLDSIDGHFGISRGLFVNRNHFAALINYGLAMLMISGFYYLLNKQLNGYSFKKLAILFLDFVLSNKLIWLFVLAFLAIAMNLSSSRAAVLGFGVSITFVAIIGSIIDTQLRSSIKPLLLILAAFISIVVISSGETGIITRLKEGGFDLGERYEQWALTLTIFKKHWLFGTGAGTYSEIFQYYRENGDGLRDLLYDQSHSHYLHTLLEQGIIGFTLWISSLVVVFVTLLIGFKKQKSSYSRAVILGVFVGLIVSLLQSFVDFNLMIPSLNIYFYTLIAIGYAAISLYLEDTKDKEIINSSE